MKTTLTILKIKRARLKLLCETKIVNVIATAALEQKVDLLKVSKFKEIFHDSDVYGGRVAYFKKDDMVGKVSIFPSGKMIIL